MQENRSSNTVAPFAGMATHQSPYHDGLDAWGQASRPRARMHRQGEPRRWRLCCDWRLGACCSMSHYHTFAKLSPLFELFRWCFHFARVILRFGFVLVLAWHVSVEWRGKNVEQQDETTLLRVRVKEALWDMHIRSCLGWSSRRMTWTRSLISEQRLMKLCHFDAKGIFTPRWFLCLQSQAGFPSFHAEMFFPAYLTDYRMIWFIHSFFLSFPLWFLSLFLSFFLLLLSSYLSYLFPLLSFFPSSPPSLYFLSFERADRIESKLVWVAASPPFWAWLPSFSLFCFRQRSAKPLQSCLYLHDPSCVQHVIWGTALPLRIGADALASLGLVVDCKHRRLLEEDRPGQGWTGHSCPQWVVP